MFRTRPMTSALMLPASKSSPDDVVAAGDAALRLARRNPRPRFALLMRGEFRLASEFHALRLRVGAASCCAFGDAAAFQLRGDAKHGKHKLGKIARGIEHRLRQRTQASPGALHVAGDHQKVGRVAREAVNCRDYHHVAGGEGGHQLLKLRAVGGRAGDLLAEHLLASGRLELGKLAGEVLGDGRDAGIAVNHARILHQNFASEKPNLISGRRLHLVGRLRVACEGADAHETAGRLFRTLIVKKSRHAPGHRGRLEHMRPVPNRRSGEGPCKAARLNPLVYLDWSRAFISIGRLHTSARVHETACLAGGSRKSFPSFPLLISVNARPARPI